MESLYTDMWAPMAKWCAPLETSLLSITRQRVGPSVGPTRWWGRLREILLICLSGSSLWASGRLDLFDVEVGLIFGQETK